MFNSGCMQTVNGQKANTDFVGRTNSAAQRFNSAPVTFKPWQAPLRCPPTIAIHDDGDVFGNEVRYQLGHSKPRSAFIDIPMSCLDIVAEAGSAC